MDHIFAISIDIEKQFIRNASDLSRAGKWVHYEAHTDLNYLADHKRNTLTELCVQVPVRDCNEGGKLTPKPQHKPKPNTKGKAKAKRSGKQKRGSPSSSGEEPSTSSSEDGMDPPSTCKVHGEKEGGGVQVSKLEPEGTPVQTTYTLGQFMQEMVPVYEQNAIHTCGAGLITECTKLNDIPRIEFYRSFLKRFAHDVCDCQEALECIDAALQCLEGLTAVKALDMFTEWLFPTDRYGIEKGGRKWLCSRDMPMSKISSAFTAEIMHNEGTANDFLDAIGNFDGMSRNKALLHNGGVVWLGMQVEESCMETRDVMIDVTQLIKEGTCVDGYDVRVLKQVCKLSAKRWLVNKKECSYESMMELEELICDEFGEAFSGWEQCIQSKAYLLNHKYWLDKHADKMQEVLQLPGEVIRTRNARCCMGHSALSLSWCTCDPLLLKKYIELEMRLAINTPPMAPARAMPTRGIGIAFSISCELANAYDVHYEKDPRSGFVSGTRGMVQYMFQKCMSMSGAKEVPSMCKTGKYVPAALCDSYTAKGNSIVCVSCGFPLPFIAISRKVDYQRVLFCGRCTNELWPTKTKRRGCNIFFIRSHLLVGLHEYCC